jgi:hypothetical protein
LETGALPVELRPWVARPIVERRLRRPGDGGRDTAGQHFDNRIVASSSFNYTQPANDYNDENLFEIGAAR